MMNLQDKSIERRKSYAYLDHRNSSCSMVAGLFWTDRLCWFPSSGNIVHVLLVIVVVLVP